MNPRPTTMAVAAVLLALFSLVSVASVAIPAFSEGVPAVVVYGGAALGIVGLVAAYGLWSLKKWGAWLTIALSILNILSAAPGLAFAPTAVLFASALVGVAGYALIVILILMPISRRAYAGEAARRTA